MRIRSQEFPPTRADIDRILAGGVSADDSCKFPSLLRRLRQSCFLDKNYRPLSVEKRLIEQYRTDGLVLFLGAEVSVGSGIPTWPKLAEEVLGVAGIASRKMKDLQQRQPSLISQFQLASRLLGDPTRFTKTLFEHLYKDLECKPQLEAIPKKYESQKTWIGWDRVFKALGRNETLAAVGDLLIAGNSRSPRRNPQIHAVVTFNADNLLELYCEAKARGRRVITMVDRASVSDHPDRTPVYHLHGALDARGENFLRVAPTSVPASDVQELTSDLLPDLVFKEAQYYETIASPFSFINHTPQSFLRRLNALFIGTSLDDLNVRRWLYDSFRERVRHRVRYLREFYWRKYSDVEFEAELASTRHFWLRTGSGIDATGQRHIELGMKDFGIDVSWCKDYPALQKSLRDLGRIGYCANFGRRVAVFPS